MKCINIHQNYMNISVFVVIFGLFNFFCEGINSAPKSDIWLLWEKNNDGDRRKVN